MKEDLNLYLYREDIYMKTCITRLLTFDIPLIVLLMMNPVLTFSQVVINEGSNKNYSTLTDEDGGQPDWIELFNAGSDPVDLNGYSLSDDLDEPAKWVMPHNILNAGAYQVIFCSEKNRFASPPFTTVENTGVFVPVTGWNTHHFTTPFYWDGTSNIIVNTCSYSSLGYTTNAVFNQSSTSYNSTIFAVADGSPASCSFYNGTPVAVRPNMKLNGVAIGTDNLQNCNTCYPAPYGNWYWGARNQMLIHADELQAAGLTAGYIDSLAFDVAWTDAVTYDYIEISMGLTAVSSMTNEFLPATGFNYHTNFKISGSGETVYLFSPSGNLLSSLNISCESYDVSIGSIPDASITHAYLSPPTPGATNNSSFPYTQYAEAPVLSQSSGFFTQPFDVTMSVSNGGAGEIHYTLDGSDPEISSPEFDGTPVPIYQSTVVKAKTFVEGMLPSNLTAATYFFNVSHLTPILSVITDNNNLYGDNGIFDHSEQDWLRPAYAEYFDSTSGNPLIFSQNAGMMIDGGYGGSRWQPQHSFRLELDNSVLGEGPVNFPVIPQRPQRTKYSQFYLRNGSNQYLVLPYKDASQLKMMGEKTYNYYTAWRPISVYINGQYFGLYELREKYDPELFEVLDSASEDSMDILSLSAFYGFVLRAVTGSVDSFWSSYDAFKTISPADTAFWTKADKYFDMMYYNDYIIAESWMGNVDWPGNNIKIYRSDKTDFRWRFCLIDQELALLPNSWTDCYFDHISYLQSLGDYFPYTDIWNRGMQNPRFRNYFINRFADLMNTAYLPDSLLAVENGMFNQTIVEMANEYARWADPWNVPAWIDFFYDNHLTFQSELQCRTDQVRSDIQHDLSLAGQVNVTLDVDPPGAGRIQISTITPALYPWQGVYFNSVPIKIEAMANDGYVFSHWDDNNVISDVLNPVINNQLSAGPLTFRAHFEQLQTNAGEADVSEDFRVFPSLVDDELKVLKGSNANESNLRFEITDMNGRVVSSGTLNAHGFLTEIDAQQLRPSLYVLTIWNEERPVRHFRFCKINGN